MVVLMETSQTPLGPGRPLQRTEPTEQSFQPLLAPESSIPSAVPPPVPGKTYITADLLARMKENTNTLFPNEANNLAPGKFYLLNGVTFTNYPYHTLVKGMPLQLRQDAYGKVRGETHSDPLAVSVGDSQGVHVGYIPKQDEVTKEPQAAAVFQALTDGKPLTARVDRVYYPDRQGQPYGLKIEVHGL
jgi:hypothetical protein